MTITLFGFLFWTGYAISVGIAIGIRICLWLGSENIKTIIQILNQLRETSESRN
jgi:hypothetical protein